MAPVVCLQTRVCGMRYVGWPVMALMIFRKDSLCTHSVCYSSNSHLLPHWECPPPLQPLETEIRYGTQGKQDWTLLLEEIQADQYLQGEEKVRAAKRREIALAIQNYPTRCVDAFHARLKTLPVCLTSCIYRTRPATGAPSSRT